MLRTMVTTNTTVRGECCERWFRWIPLFEVNASNDGNHQAVDGIEICSSFARCCNACMERKVERKVAGQMQTDIQYYHRIAAVTLVSSPFPIPLGIRFQKDGEGEVGRSEEHT